MKRRSKTVLLALLVTASILGTACSDGIRDAARVDGTSRSAAGASSGSDASVNLDEFCSTFKRGGFLTAAEIATCFVLDNQTAKFTAPNKLGSRVALTVPKAECGSKWDSSKVSGDPCEKTSGKYGEIRNTDNGDVYGPRILTPNPFRGIGAIQFQSAAMYAGAEETVYVGSSEAPFTLAQAPAKAFFSTPYSADNGGYCASQGQFLSCSLVDGSFASKGDWPRPRFIFETRPLRIEIKNNTSFPISLTSGPSTSATLLLDPVARGGLDNIAAGAYGYDGGYRSTSSDSDQTYAASMCLNWRGNYNGTVQDVCIAISLNIVLKKVDGRWVSNMNPQNGTAGACDIKKATVTFTPKCEVFINDSDSDRFVTIAINTF